MRFTQVLRKWSGSKVLRAIDEFVVCIAEWARKRAVFQILGVIGVVFAVIGFNSQIQEQRMARTYQAWQTINAAEGKPSPAGRILALQDLNEIGESLVGVRLNKALLSGIKLPYASLARAEMNETNLDEANLLGADLEGANLNSANLEGANLKEANLTFAKLGRANLTGANLEGAKLFQANLKGANLSKSKGWRNTIIEFPVNLFIFKGTPAGFESKESFKAWADSNGAVFLQTQKWNTLKKSVRAAEAKPKY